MIRTAGAEDAREGIYGASFISFVCVVSFRMLLYTLVRLLTGCWNTVGIASFAIVKLTRGLILHFLSERLLDFCGLNFITAQEMTRYNLSKICLASFLCLARIV